MSPRKYYGGTYIDWWYYLCIYDQDISTKDYLDTYLPDPVGFGVRTFCGTVGQFSQMQTTMSLDFPYSALQTDIQTDGQRDGPTCQVIMLKKRYCRPAPGPSLSTWILDDAKTRGVGVFQQEGTSWGTYIYSKVLLPLSHIIVNFRWPDVGPHNYTKLLLFLIPYVCTTVDTNQDQQDLSVKLVSTYAVNPAPWLKSRFLDSFWSIRVFCSIKSFPTE